MVPPVLSSVPFVDLRPQHDPLQPQLEDAFRQLLNRGDFVLGEALTQFEQDFAAACGVQHGVGVACGTDGLALGLQACGLGEGTSVLLPANTFVATLIGVMRTGATPILVDCDPDTGLIDLDAAADCLRRDTRAIVAVHLYGQMVSPTALFAFADAHNLIIFEDAAQAHLAEREGYRAGSLGKAAAFSFYPSKNLGCLGDGGMVVTPDQDVAKKIAIVRNYGAPRKYFHTELGTNSRLDTFQAAVLALKLPHLEAWNQERNRLAQRYDAALKEFTALSPLENHSGPGHVYHLYIVRLEREIDRNALQATLEEQGIQTGVHYPLPCHLQPAFRNLCYELGDFPQAEYLSQTIFSLPMYPGLQESQQDKVIEALRICLSLPSRVQTA
ncbi:MAG: DegT/DnrJ/EryC1/StrS family aminotransferase [Synechococcales cyanobacterium RU_4_20]|nr:DegT/DnrJ/EryC1/StrS family aminotransferase [Synechococcales cyanobacterium RU_4_20]